MLSMLDSFTIPTVVDTVAGGNIFSDAKHRLSSIEWQRWAGHDDDVGVADGGEAVGDHKHRSVLKRG